MYVGDTLQTADSVLDRTQEVLDGLGAEDPLRSTVDATQDLLTDTGLGVQDILTNVGALEDVGDTVADATKEIDADVESLQVLLISL